MTIRELEQLSENLQGELSQKEDLYALLKGDYQRLEARLRDVAGQQEGEEAEKIKHIKQMEDEINYLKKHFEVEMGLLKDENEILQRELTHVLQRHREMSQYSLLTPNNKNNAYSP